MKFSNAEPTGLSWNKKILDYEIETILSPLHTPHFSIGWNKKILDYEIETAKLAHDDGQLISVEIRRFSITRLKQIFPKAPISK